MQDKSQIDIEFVFTKELFRESYSNLFDAKVRPQNFIWLGLILLVYFIYNLYTTGFHTTDLWFYLPLAGVPLGLWFAKFYLPRKWGDRTFKQYEGKRFHWIITDQNIQITSHKSKANFAWSHFEKAIIGQKIIFLESANNRRTPIPVSAFAPKDLELFKKWMDEKISKYTNAKA